MAVRRLPHLLVIGLLLVACSQPRPPATPGSSTEFATATGLSPATTTASAVASTIIPVATQPVATRPSPTPSGATSLSTEAPSTAVLEATLSPVPQPKAGTGLDLPGEEPLSPELARLIDPIVEQSLQSFNVAGLSLAIQMGPGPIYVKGYGFADVSSEMPAVPTTIYEIGSITKQFTAAAVMQLVESGALELDDAAALYLDYWPPAWQEITIHQLLNHTSGIPNYTTLHSQGVLDIRFDAEFSTQGLISAVADLDLPLDFAPGSQWRYSNTGYLLLGAIIEQVSQEPYSEYLEEHITSRLGLDATSFCSVPHPGLAQGYQIGKGELRLAAFIHPSVRGAAGGICSTAGDLVRWLLGLREGDVVSPASYEQMIHPETLGTGQVLTYGYGMRVTLSSGRDTLSHGGGTSGFKARLVYYPDQDLTLAVLANTSSPAYKPEALTSAVADSLLSGTR